MGSDTPLVRLFVEDIAHERFLDALVRRISREEEVKSRILTGSGKGGASRAFEELKLFQRAIRNRELPDLLVVAIDTNCHGWNQRHKEVLKQVDVQLFPHCVVACPDPHVERWYLADPPSLVEKLGVKTVLSKRKCRRDLYKNVLRQVLRDAGHVLTLGGVEFADEIVSSMDFFRASKNEPSLKHCIDELRSALRNVR